MAARPEVGDRDSAAAALQRVLEAERDAEAELAARRRDAARLVDAARDDALAIVNRALDRAAHRQHRHARALALRTGRLRAQGGDQSAEGAPDPRAVARAVEHVAAELTGGAIDGAR